MRTRPMVVLVLTAIVAQVAVWPAEAFGRLCPFGRHRNQVSDPKSCAYGWERDACGNTVCTKGPGEICGGKHGRYGVCGEGLMCSNCNRCQGCSFRTFECYDDRHCIWPRER